MREEPRKRITYKEYNDYVEYKIKNFETGKFEKVTISKTAHKGILEFLFMGK